MTFKHLAHAGISTFALLFSTTLLASGFCDDVPPIYNPSGGYCAQARVTFGDHGGVVSPDYSDLNWQAMLGNSPEPILFGLNVKHLFAPQTLIAHAKPSRIAVFELQLADDRNFATDQYSHQALVLTASHQYPNRWTLTFAWSRVAPTWSIVSDSARPPSDVWVVEIPDGLQPEVFMIQLSPSLDWRTIAASAWVLKTDFGDEIWAAPTGKVFEVSQLMASPAPWRIRSGVLSGTLVEPGQTANLSYFRPYIETAFQ